MALRDTAEEVARERRQRDAAARVDRLTAMPNRAAVRDYLQFGLDLASTTLARHCAVLFINVDRFKQINDSLGYSAGDEVLTLLANRLRSALRQGVRQQSAEGREPIAGRLGGDEFAVVLDDLAQGDDVHRSAPGQFVLNAACHQFVRWREHLANEPLEPWPSTSRAASSMLPVDTLKIDRSFVSEAVTSAHLRALVEATVRVAASLDMRTVAEGIETAQQADVIRELGCDKAQGYFFSRPLLPEQLAAWALSDAEALPR